MKRERGVAVITAILIVAVAASAATFMLSQQSAMVDQAILLASRAQADHYAEAGLDWARGVLAEDGQRAGAVDHLGEGWAQPIAALPMDRAIVAGAIEDAEGFAIRSMPISPAELWELRQQHTTTTDPVPAQEGSR